MSDRTNWTFGQLAAAGHLEFGDGYRTKRDEHGRPGFPILRVAEVFDGRIVAKFSDYVSCEYEKYRAGKLSRVGDLVLTTKGTVGRVAVINAGSPQFVYSPQLCYFRIAERSPLLLQFLRYWLKSSEFWSQATALKGQTDMADYLNLADIRGLKISVPSRDRQLAVSEILSVLDDKKVVDERIVDTSLELAKCHFRCLMSQERFYLQRRVGEVAEVYDGPHATPVKTDNGPWFLSISSLSDGVLDLDESAHLSDDDYVKWTRRVVPRSGDVLFSYETRLGAAALMPDGLEASLGRRMGLLRPRSGEIEPAVLLHSYLANGFQEVIRQRAIHGATVDRISLVDLAAWPISVPTPEARQQITPLLNALHNRINSALKEVRTLAELRDTLLSKLISGEIRIKDAEKAVEEI
jgi:type I restriction enzyme S subunit